MVCRKSDIAEHDGLVGMVGLEKGITDTFHNRGEYGTPMQSPLLTPLSALLAECLLPCGWGEWRQQTDAC